MTNRTHSRPNAPVPPRYLLRTKVLIFESKPILMMDPMMDEGGPHAINKQSFNGYDLLKFVYRSNQSTARLCQPILWEDVSNQDKQMYARMMGWYSNSTGEYWPMDGDEESTEAKQAEALMISIVKEAIKLNIPTEKFIHNYCMLHGGAQTVTVVGRHNTVSHVVNLTRPTLVYKCSCCSTHSAIMDLDANSAESSMIYQQATIDEPDGQFVKNRGIDEAALIPLTLWSGLKEIYPNSKPHKTTIFNHEYNKWHCPICGNDLTLAIVAAVGEESTVSGTTKRYVDGTKLKELNLVRYGDIYDDIIPEVRMRVIESDARKLAKARRHYFDYQCIIPANLSIEDMGDLVSLYPGMAPSTTNVVIASQPAFAAEVEAALAHLYSLLGKQGEICVSGTTSVGSNLSNVTMKNQHMFGATRSKSSPPVKPRYWIAGEVGVSVKTIATWLTTQRVVYGLTINHCDGELMSGVGKISNGMLFLSGNPLGLNLNTEWLSIANCDYISMRNMWLSITTYHFGKHINIVAITESSQVSNVMLSNNNSRTIQVAMPDNFSFFGKLPVLNLMPKEITIHPKLIKALVLRNMTNTMTTDQLVSVAELYCRQIRNNKGMVLHNKDIKYSHMLYHVIIAQSYQLSTNRMSLASSTFTDMLQWVGPLRGLIPPTLNAAKDFVVYTILGFLKSTINSAGLTADKLIDQLRGFKWTNYNQLWNHLLEDDLINKEREPRIMSMDETAVTYHGLCRHHTTRCSHLPTGDGVCDCCNLPCDITKNLCECCDMSPLAKPVFNWEDDQPKQHKRHRFKKKVTLADRLSNLAVDEPEDNVDPDVVSVHSTDETTDEIVQESPPEVSGGTQPMTGQEAQIHPAANKPMKSAAEELFYDAMSDNSDELSVKSVAANTYAMVAMTTYDDFTKNQLLRPIEPIRMGLSKKSLLPLGDYMLSTQVVDCTTTYDVESEDGDCVLGCISHVLECDIRDLKDLFNPNKWLKTTDIPSIASKLRINIALVTPNGIIVSINNKEDELITLKEEQSSVGKKVSHCVLCQLKSVAQPGILTTTTTTCSVDDICLTTNCELSELYCQPIDDLTYLMDCKRLDKLLTVKPHHLAGMGKVYTRSDSACWQFPDNNRIHDPAKGLISVQFDPRHVQVMRDIIAGTIPTAAVERNDSTDIPSDITEYVNISLRSEQFKLDEANNSHIRVGTTGNLVPIECKNIRPSQLGCWLRLDRSIAIKTFDVVYFSQPSLGKRVIIKGVVKARQHNEWLVDTGGAIVAKSAKVKKCIYSAGSCIRRITTLLRMSTDREKIVNLLSTATGMIGPPGAGKTTSLTSLGAGDYAIASTSGATYRLREVVTGATPTIMSVESFMNHSPANINKTSQLVVDESNSAPWIVAAVAVNFGIKKLVVLGDPGQISLTDMSSDVGIIKPLSLLESAIKHATVGNIVVTNESWRVPPTLCAWLRSVGADIVPHPDSVVNWEPKLINISSIDDLPQLIDNAQPELILTALQTNKRKISNLTSVEVGTTHANMGIERKTGMVVLAPDNSNSWGLNGDAYYTYVACTRFKAGLTIVIVNRNHFRTLKDTVSRTIGMRSTVKKLVPRSITTRVDTSAPSRAVSAMARQLNSRLRRARLRSSELHQSHLQQPATSDALELELVGDDENNLVNQQLLAVEELVASSTNQTPVAVAPDQLIEVSSSPESSSEDRSIRQSRLSELDHIFKSNANCDDMMLNIHEWFKSKSLVTTMEFAKSATTITLSHAATGVTTLTLNVPAVATISLTVSEPQRHIRIKNSLMLIPRAITASMVKLTMASIIGDMTVTFADADGSGSQVLYRPMPLNATITDSIDQPSVRQSESAQELQLPNPDFQSTTAVDGTQCMDVTGDAQTPQPDMQPVPECVSISASAALSGMTDQIQPAIQRCMPLKDWDDDPEERMCTDTNLRGSVPTNWLIKLEGSSPSQKRTWFNQRTTSERGIIPNEYVGYSFSDLIVMDFRLRMNLRLLAWMVDMTGGQSMQVLLAGTKVNIRTSRSCEWCKKLTVYTDTCMVRHALLSVGDVPRYLAIYTKAEGDLTLYHWLSGIDVPDWGGWPNPLLMWTQFAIEGLGRLGTWGRKFRPSITSDLRNQYRLLSRSDNSYCDHKWWPMNSDQDCELTSWRQFTHVYNSVDSDLIALSSLNMDYIMQFVTADLAWSSVRYNKKLVLGEFDDILTIPVSTHMIKNTQVATMIKQINSLELERNNSQTHQMLWMPNCDNQLKSDVTNVCPRLSKQTLKSHKSFCSWAEINEAIMVLTMGHKQPKDPVYVGPFPHLPALHNMHYCKLSMPADSLLQSMYNANVPIAERELSSYVNIAVEKNNDHKVITIAKVECDWQKASSSTIMMGLSILTLGPEQLNRLLDKGNTLIGIVPMAKKSPYYEYKSDNLYLQGTDHPIKINPKWLLATVAGQPLDLNLRVQTLAPMIDCCLIKVERTPHRLAMTCTAYMNARKTVVNMPLINNNIQNLLNGEPLIMSKEVKIDTRLYRSVMLKAQKLGTSRSKIQNHVRSVALTEVTSETYIGLDKDVSAAEAIHTVNIAIAHASNLTGQINMFKSAIDKVNNNAVGEAFINQFVGLMQNITGMVAELASELRSFLSDAAFTLIDNDVLNKFVKEQEKLMLTIDESHDKLVYWGDSESDSQSSKRIKTTTYGYQWPHDSESQSSDSDNYDSDSDDDADDWLLRAGDANTQRHGHQAGNMTTIDQGARTTNVYSRACDSKEFKKTPSKFDPQVREKHVKFKLNNKEIITYNKETPRLHITTIDKPTDYSSIISQSTISSQLIDNNLDAIVDVSGPSHHTTELPQLAHIRTTTPITDVWDMYDDASDAGHAELQLGKDAEDQPSKLTFKNLMHTMNQTKPTTKQSSPSPSDSMDVTPCVVESDDDAAIITQPTILVDYLLIGNFRDAIINPLSLISAPGYLHELSKDARYAIYDQLRDAVKDATGHIAEVNNLVLDVETLQFLPTNLKANKVIVNVAGTSLYALGLKLAGQLATFASRFGTPLFMFKKFKAAFETRLAKANIHYNELDFNYELDDHLLSPQWKQLTYRASRQPLRGTSALFISAAADAMECDLIIDGDSYYPTSHLMQDVCNLPELRIAIVSNGPNATVWAEHTLPPHATLNPDQAISLHHSGLLVTRDELILHNVSDSAEYAVGSDFISGHDTMNSASWLLKVKNLVFGKTIIDMVKIVASRPIERQTLIGKLNRNQVATLHESLPINVTMCDISVILHDPKTKTHCVRDCLNYYGMPVITENVVNSNCDVQDVLDELRIAHQPTRLILCDNTNDSNQLCLNINDNRPGNLAEFAINSDPRLEQMHCVAVTASPASPTKIKPNPYMHLDFNPPNPMRCKPGTTAVTKQMVAHAKSKLMLKAFDADMDRARPVILHHKQVVNATIVAVPASAVKDRCQLLWLMTTVGMELHLVEFELQGEWAITHVSTTATLKVIGFLLNCANVDKPPRTQLTLTKGNLCMNYTEQRTLSNMGLETVVATLSSRGQMFLHNFYNRSHHNRADWEDLADNVVTGWLVVVSAKSRHMISMDQFRPSKNKPFDRMVLLAGKIDQISEGATLLAAAVFSSFNPGTTRSNTNVIGPTEPSTHKQFKIITSQSQAQMFALGTTPFDTCIETVSDQTLKLQLGKMEWCNPNQSDATIASNLNHGSFSRLEQDGAVLLSSGTIELVVFRENWTIYQVSRTMGARNDPLAYPSGNKVFGKESAMRWFKDPTTAQPVTTSTLVQLEEFDHNHDVEYLGSTAPRTKPPLWSVVPVPDGITKTKHTVLWRENHFKDEHYMAPLEPILNQTSLEAYDFWTSNDLTISATKYGPNTKGRLKTKESATATRPLVKHSLVPFPEQSRPVATNMLYKDHNTITGRLMSVLELRTVKPPHILTLQRMAAAYFHDKSADLCDGFQQNQIGFNTTETLKWVSTHHRANHVINELQQFLCAGTTESSISDINVHLKLESLLKPDKIIKSFIEQQPRSIMWQSYFVSAIFSPIFIEIKRRLKLLLHDKVLYADGFTPQDIQEFLNNKQEPKYFVENDLEKQDRQTDHHTISLELTLYRALGCSEAVLELWQTVHEVWRFKSNYSWGFCEAMRLTGQSTTSLGNWITNMQSHADFVSTNLDKLCWVLLLGDDNNMGFNSVVDTSNLSAHIKTNFNMVSKLKTSHHQGSFCCFLTTTHEGRPVLVPDLTRMRHRFEVPNGVSEANPDNIKMRALSYLMMLGSTSLGDELARQIKSDAIIESWYPMEAALFATAAKYDVPVHEVENDVSLLLQTIKESNISEHVWEIWAPKRL